VNARLLVDTVKGAVIVPTAAVQRGPESTFAYVVKPNSTVELRPVTVGPAEGESSSIKSGISPGEVVVTDGVDKLQPGTKVAVQHGPATRPTSAPAATTAEAPR
jgi:multidrug efflux system membrane fusion protein